MKEEIKEEVFYPKRLTYLRVMNKMTETELARKCQCSKQLISFIESGFRTPKKPMILMFCKVFKVSEEFFTRYKFDMTVIGNNFLVIPDNP